MQGSTVKPFSIGDGAARSRSGFFGGGESASPGLTALMERHGRGTKGFFGTKFGGGPNYYFSVEVLSTRETVISGRLAGPSCNHHKIDYVTQV